MPQHNEIGFIEQKTKSNFISFFFLYFGCFLSEKKIIQRVIILYVFLLRTKIFKSYNENKTQNTGTRLKAYKTSFNIFCRVYK